MIASDDVSTPIVRLKLTESLKLSLKLGFASTGAAPGTAPDVKVTLGNSYSVTIPGAEFSGPSRDRFTARRPDSASAVSKATLDYGRELHDLDPGR